MKLKMTALGLILVLAAALASCSSSDKSTDPRPHGYTGIFGISYPPVGSDAEILFSAAAMGLTLGVDHLRFSAHWDLIQPDNADGYDWETFDRKMRFVRNNHLNLFLTVEARGPDWACGAARNERSCLIDDPEAFRSFLTELLKRHGDDIAVMQFGNEMTSPDFWVGTVEEFTALNNIFYDQVKALRPDMPVALGGFSTGALRIFAACSRGKDLPIPMDRELLTGAQVDSLCATEYAQIIDEKVMYLVNEASYDIIDLHLYDDPEYWPLLAEAIGEVAPGVPLMVTEFGGPMVSCVNSTDDCILGWTENDAVGTPYTQEYHAERMAFYMETLKAMPVERAYHFKLLEDTEPGKVHDKSALYRYTGGSIVPKQPVIDAFVAHK